MLTFKNTNIIFTLIALVLVGMNYFFHLSNYLYLALFIGWSAIIFYGCYNIQSNFFMKIICSANTTEKIMALTFDDGPSQFSSEILRVLKEQKVESAFFLIGNKIKGNEALLKEISNNGHIIGNHSYSHSYIFDFFPSQKIFRDLKKLDDLVYQVDNIRPHFFRPPYGVVNSNIARAIKKGKLHPYWLEYSFHGYSDP